MMTSTPSPFARAPKVISGCSYRRNCSSTRSRREFVGSATPPIVKHGDPCPPRIAGLRIPHWLRFGMSDKEIANDVVRGQTGARGELRVVRLYLRGCGA